MKLVLAAHGKAKLPISAERGMFSTILRHDYYIFRHYMKRYIAYFDFLGYKYFILNNTTDRLRVRAGHILRDIGLALAGDNELLVGNGVLFPDIRTTRINCLNISDTVIFWSQDSSLESLRELIAVAHHFNWMQNLHNMPARGVVVCEEMEILRDNEQNQAGAVYSTSLVYGKGLYNAHVKAESLSFAGCVVDQSVLAEMEAGGIINGVLEQFAKRYIVPYKNGELEEVEYVLKIVSGALNDETFHNCSALIRSRFSADNKPVDSDRVQELIRNSIEFLASFREA